MTFPARLAIDTSIGTSVALSFGERVVTLSSEDERGHTEVIGSLMAGVFEQSGVSPEQVGAVVVGIGPGPFTGLRVGIAAAKAFAAGRGVPLLPICGHDAVAYHAMRDASDSMRGARDTMGDAADAMRDASDAQRIRVLQDAKRRELFATGYAGLDQAGLPVRVSEARLLPRTDYTEAPGDVWPAEISASTLLRLAELRLRAGRGFEADRAIYLRSPDVYQAAAVKRVSS